MQRLVLALDLLLPDIVHLGVRDAFEIQVRAVRGAALLAIVLLRLSGWLIISVLIYGIIARTSY